jgi:hypothetical protein
MNTPTLTRDTPKRFITSFNFLASTKATVVDDLRQESYFSLLGELPIESVEKSARQLALDPSRFLPSAGEWYTMADVFACESLEDSSSRLLPAAREVKAKEIASIKKARAGCLKKMEEYLGHAFHDRHPWKQDIIEIPTYACLICHDSGWKTLPPSAEEFRLYGSGGGQRTVERCPCCETNPVIVRQLAHIQTNSARGKRP